MDLKAYFQKVRDAESAIEGDFTVVVSLETSDGGRPGQLTEVTKQVAARLVVDGKARLASHDEIRDFYQEIQCEREEFLRRDVENRINVTLVTDRPLPEPKPRRRLPKDEEK